MRRACAWRPVRRRFLRAAGTVLAPDAKGAPCTRRRPGLRNFLNIRGAGADALSGARTAAVAAAAVLAVAAAAWAGPTAAHAAAHGEPPAVAIGAQWEIVDAVVAAGADARGRDGTVVIAGTTDRPGEPVLVTARSPDGYVVDRRTAGASPLDGSLLAEVPTGGPGWAADGLYTVTLYQGAAGRQEPYVDIVPVAMSGGLAAPNPELSGAPLPAAAAAYAEPRVLNLRWSMIEEVVLAPGGGRAGGDAVGLSGTAPDGRDSVTVRVVAPTGLEMASFAADAGGPLGEFSVSLETDGSAWSQDGKYRITVDGGLRGSSPDLLLVDVFDGSVVIAASASAAAADPRGEGAAGYDPGGAREGALIEKRWDLIDAVAVSGQGGQGQRVVIAGSTDLPGVPVSVRILDPNGRQAHGSAVLPDAGTGRFVLELPAAGDAWSVDGTYSAGIEQRDALTGKVRYSDLLGLEVHGGAVAAQPRLPASLLPPDVAAAYGDALLVALEYAVVEEVRAESPAGGGQGRYAEIAVYGRTFDRPGPVSVAVEAPDGSAAPPSLAEPGPDGRFEARVQVSGEFWSADGGYVVTVTQGNAERFVDIAVVDVRDGAVQAGRPPAAAAAAGPDGGQPPASSRIMNIGERWKIIDAIVLAEDSDAAQSIVIVGTTDVVDRAVQAAIEAPGGEGTVVALREAMPDGSGAVVIEVPVGGDAWGEPRPADGTYALTVGQPGTRYLDGYPLYVLGGRVAAPAEFGGAPLPPAADSYESARLLDAAWSLVTRADVVVSGGAGMPVVVVQGETDHPKVPVAVRAVAPGGSVVHDAPVAPRADGSFEARIDASGAEWSGDGAYRITVGQGFGSVPPDLVLVEVVDGAVVPEFGALAAVALAAAVAAAVAGAIVAAPHLGLAWPRPTSA